jgi:hypothetical protein
MAGSRRDDDRTVIWQRTSGDETIHMQHPEQVQTLPPAPTRKRGNPWIWVAAVLAVLFLCLVTMAGTLYIVKTDTLKGLIGGEIRALATSAPDVAPATPVAAVTAVPGEAVAPTHVRPATEESVALSSASEAGTEQPVPTKLVSVTTAEQSPTATESVVSQESSPIGVEVAAAQGSPAAATEAALAEVIPPSATAVIVTDEPPPAATEEPTPTTTEVVVVDEPPPPAATTPAPIEDPLPPAPPGMRVDVTEEATPVARVVGGDNTESGIPAPTGGLTASMEEGPLAPIIGPMSFSAVTSAGGTLEASNTFAGEITEVHALFAYQNMADGTPWERLWYLDDRTMAKGSGMWDKGPEGTYHLTLAAGGNPLSGGRWRLEIHVDGQLMQEGEFIIEAPTPSPMPTPELTRPTPTVTEVPPATPTEAPLPTIAPLATPTATAVTVKKYTLAFSRWDGVKHNLFIAQTDGSGETFLLQSAAGPSWSPDGRYLVFFGEAGITEQERDGNRYRVEGISDGIIRLNATTWSPDPTAIELHQYAQDGTARWAAWSPSGDMVAYDAKHGGNDWRIYFLGTADNQQFSYELVGEQGDWSPDSNRLVCRSGRDNRQGIWIANRDDTNWVQVTSDGNDAFPRWSPDGAKIAFHRESGGDVDLYVMNADGSNIRRLTDATGPDTLPVWTPDGRIVFRSARSGSWAIYLMNADSSGQKQIIANADPGPDWSFGRMDVK